MTLDQDAPLDQPKAPPAPPSPPGVGAAGGRRWLSRRVRRLLLVLVALLCIPAFSYVRALTYPGSASWQVRSVEWVRDHGGSGLVDAIENWRYRTPPPSHGSAAGEVPVSSGPPTLSPADLIRTGQAPARLVASDRLAPLRGEGIWHSTGWTLHGLPMLETSFLRVNPAHPTVLTGFAWIRQPGLTLRLQGGTREPLPGARWPGRAQVPPPELSRLVATFNSGWKVQDAHGGWFGEGRLAVPLRPGAASLVVDSTGRAGVTAWNGGTAPPPGMLVVRQNLHLVVDGGRAVPGLNSNAGGRWGSAHNQLQFTTRSGIGEDAHGNLVYVAGGPMNLAVLATALVDAGAVRGMELDIHPAMVGFNLYPRPAAGTGRILGTPVKLLPYLRPPATRYLAADQRDFFTLTAAGPLS
jgi:hypothetical protein